MQLNKKDKLKVNIENLDHYGVGIARVNNFPIFIPDTLPNELVNIEITSINKKLAKGKVISYSTISPNRIEKICPYFTKCGGCNLMNVGYKITLDYKRNKIIEILKKFGKIDVDTIKINNVVHENYKNYRNKVVFHVKNNKLGFYDSGTTNLIEIDKCLIINNNFNDIIKILKTDLNNIDEICLRYSHYEDKVMVIIKTTGKINKDMVSLLSEEPKISSIYINDKHIFGKKYLEEKLVNKVFKISPKSFFQTNTLIAEKMFKKVKDYINDKDINILDLYCGTGVIGLIISKDNKKIIGVDSVKESIMDANNNKKLNGVTNVKFICEKTENILPVIEKTNKNIDVIILDPPRSGCDKNSLDIINNLLPKKIIYISCDPVTLARDLNKLKTKYEIFEITPFDMFPYTHHVECVCVLNIR